MISWEDIVYGIKRAIYLVIYRTVSVCLSAVGRKQVVPPINDPLLLTSATKLAALIREGKLKSETVIRSYIKRIQEVQPYLNAMTYDRFEKALQEAKEVDEIVASGAKSLEEMAKETPLLGVPFTAKVFFGVKGGEAALCSSGASVIGLANDLAGSIRIPCTLCCLFGHKATPGLTDSEIFPNTPSSMRTFISTGPICRYAEDLVTFMNVVLGPKSEEMKLDRKVDFSKVTIYYTHTLPKHFAVPPLDDEVLFAQLKVALYFKAKFGCTVKYVDLKTIETSDAVTRRFQAVYGKNTVLRILNENKCNINGSIQLLKGLFGKSKLSTTTALTVPLIGLLMANPRDLPKIEEQAKALQAELDSLLNGNSVLLYPTFPAKYMQPLKGYFTSAALYMSSFATVTSLPVTQCPVGTTDDGYPMGIQVIGGKYKDYLTLAFATELEKAFGGWIPPTSERCK